MPMHLHLYGDPEFEEEDEVIHEKCKEDGFIGMIGGGLRSIRIKYFNTEERETTLIGPKSYVFHLPIATTDYKATLFNYQKINIASMMMIGRLT